MTLEERLNGLLVGDEFRFHARNGVNCAYLEDSEGDRVCRLADDCVAAIADVDSDDALALLRNFYAAAADATTVGLALGREEGRATLVRTVHELLGIDKIAEAIKVHAIATGRSDGG